ncbi:HD domain-containing protein [Mycetohabitans endofungorum]
MALLDAADRTPGGATGHARLARCGGAAVAGLMRGHARGITLVLARRIREAIRGLDLLKVLKMCVLHDLGEAIHGDISASGEPSLCARACCARAHPPRRRAVAAVCGWPSSRRDYASGRELSSGHRSARSLTAFSRC